LKRRKSVLIAVTAGVLLFGLSAAPRLLVSRTEDVANPHAVFILGEHPERIKAGARVFSASGAEVVVLTLMRRTPDALGLLRTEGVPRPYTRVVYGVSSTADEAGVARTLARRCDWERIAIVTSALHTRRAGFLFRRAVGERHHVSVVAAGPGPGWAWWSSPRSIRAVANESAKLARDTYSYFRSNPDEFTTEADC
jgi:uncharacterized SAM-binding protein YcdF (DUF218 family)